MTKTHLSLCVAALALGAVVVSQVHLSPAVHADEIPVTAPVGSPTPTPTPVASATPTPKPHHDDRDDDHDEREDLMHEHHDKDNKGGKHDDDFGHRFQGLFARWTHGFSWHK